MSWFSLQDLVTNLIANALSFLAGLLLPSLWKKLTTRKRFRALQKFWAGIDGDVLFVTCVHIANVPDGDEIKPRYLGFGDASAMKLITELLTSRLFSNQSVNIREYYEGKLLSEDRNNNLVCIGGGVANDVTTEMLYKIGVPRHFYDNEIEHKLRESKVVRNIDNTWSVKSVVVNGSVVEDVGIIVKSPHPVYPDKTIVILAGAYSYGTLAAAQFTSDEKLLRQCEHILDSEKFEIVIKAKPDGYSIAQINVEWASKI